MKTLNITYVVNDNIVQAVISFIYKEEETITLVRFDLSQEKISTDFVKLAESKEYIAACNKAMSDKIESLENPKAV